MSRPTNKPDHITVRMTTESLLARKTMSQADNQMTLAKLVFPLPGTNDISLGTMAPHTAVVGATGAGKTNILKMMMTYVLPTSKRFGGLRFRSVVYDPKRELYPYLVEAGIPESQIIVTHPFDQRSAAWDLAADFTEPAQIEELAQMIVPDSEHGSQKNENAFFETTARIIIQEVVEGLIINRGQKWDLRDVVQSVTRTKYLKAVLNQTGNGQAIWEDYFSPLETGQDTRLALNILATLKTSVKRYESLAALWYHADTKFSLKKWSRGSGILLLGSDPQRDRTVKRVNQLLLNRVSQIVRSRDEEEPVDQTWFFIDELREAGRLNGLRELLNEGRSKGARVVLGFQDIEGLRSVYGNHDAEEMVGLCANRVVLHLDTPDTREWASKFFGEAEIENREFSTSQGREKTETVNYKIEMRKNALPIEFHELKLASPSVGIVGWFALPGRRNRFHLDPRFIDQVRSPGKGPCDAPSFIERSANEQRMPPWNKEDLFELEVEDVSPMQAVNANRYEEVAQQAMAAEPGSKRKLQVSSYFQ